MLIDELRNKKDLIISIAHKYGAKEVKVFGSVARKEETAESDVDILATLPRGYDMFNQRLPLQEELEKIIGRKVDLIVKHELNKHLEAEILKEAREI